IQMGDLGWSPELVSVTPVQKSGIGLASENPTRSSRVDLSESTARNCNSELRDVFRSLPRNKCGFRSGGRGSMSMLLYKSANLGSTASSRQDKSFLALSFSRTACSPGCSWRCLELTIDRFGTAGSDEIAGPEAEDIKTGPVQSVERTPAKPMEPEEGRTDYVSRTGRWRRVWSRFRIRGHRVRPRTQHSFRLRSAPEAPRHEARTLLR